MTTKRRRRKGSGSIYHRRDGRWCAILALPAVAGRRVRQYLYATTRRAALAALAAAQIAALTPPPDAGPLTVEEYLVAWLADQAAAARTVAEYTRTVRLHILPGLGPIPLRTLTPAQVAAWLAAQRATGLGPRTLQQTYDLLRRALERAVRYGTLARNPAAAVDRPAVRATPRGTLTAAQAAQLLAATADTPWGPLWALACYTGLRRGELVALRWADYDAAGARLHVGSALDMRTGVRHAPKTAASDRWVPLAAPAVAALAVQRARGLPGPNIFAAGAGQPLRGEGVYRAFQGALLVARLPPLPFHSLRHTFATLLAEAGVDPTVRRDLLGHATTGMTAHYTHPAASQGAAGVAALAGLLDPAGE